MREYTPVNLGQHEAFSPSVLRRKHLVVVPSQGMDNTRVFFGRNHVGYNEHRQAGEAMGDHPGIIVSRIPLPAAEAQYRRRLFGSQNPQWVVPTLTGDKDGVPLDRIVLGDSSVIAALKSSIAERADSPEMVLYGYSQTPRMAEIAERLDIRFYGNPEFASWAGTKSGLAEFAAECGVPTPLTIPISDPGALETIAREMHDAGYEELVIKVDNSIGGLGQVVSFVNEVLQQGSDGNFSQYFPDEFTPEEGGVVQGWIPGATSVSLANFIDFDGSASLTGAQAHLFDGQFGGTIGAVPIPIKYLEPMLQVGRKLSEGYIRHQAFGPHTMGMLIPPPHIAERLGLADNIPLVNDENARPGASTISKAWILAIRDENYGIGWRVSKVKTPNGTKIADVLDGLEQERLLITRTGSDAHGIFVFNGALMDYGGQDKFYAIAISKDDDPREAELMMQQTKNLFT